MQIALAHDYLTQRGGAERVVLSLTRAFSSAPLYTSFYDPAETFPEYADVDVHTLPIDRIAPLRRHHRAALPLLAVSFSQLRIPADVVLCSSSGWSHGTRVEGRKIVYCHTPARWLYQSERYLRGRPRTIRGAARAVRSPLERWDRRAAATADTYLANSTVVAARIRSIYGIEAEVVPPPPPITPDGPVQEVEGVEPGFVLCVSRLLPYKNVDAVVGAFAKLRDERLIVAGSGPLERALRSTAGSNVRFVGHVTDEELRWLYASCRSLVAASHEDFGLTPLEAATFGKPTAALRWGGFLDTIDEFRSGVFFGAPTSPAIADAIRAVHAKQWQRAEVTTAAARFSEPQFIARVRAIVSGTQEPN